MIIFVLCRHKSGRQASCMCGARGAARTPTARQRAKILTTLMVTLVSLRMPNHRASLTVDASVSSAAWGRAPARRPGPACFRPFTHNSSRLRLFMARANPCRHSRPSVSGLGPPRRSRHWPAQPQGQFLHEIARSFFNAARHLPALGDMLALWQWTPAFCSRQDCFTMSLR